MVCWDVHFHPCEVKEDKVSHGSSAHLGVIMMAITLQVAPFCTCTTCAKRAFYPLHPSFFPPFYRKHRLSHVTQPQRWMKQICRMRPMSPPGNISSADTSLSLCDVEFAARATACTQPWASGWEWIESQHRVMNSAIDGEIDSANFV